MNHHSVNRRSTTAGVCGRVVEDAPDCYFERACNQRRGDLRHTHERLRGTADKTAAGGLRGARVTRGQRDRRVRGFCRALASEGVVVDGQDAQRVQRDPLRVPRVGEPHPGLPDLVVQPAGVDEPGDGPPVVVNGTSTSGSPGWRSL